MQDYTPNINGFDINSNTRFRRSRGTIDTMSLSAKYNYSYQAYCDASLNGDKYSLDAAKTRFHEITHLYQLLTTPYGCFYYNVKNYQSGRVITILQLLQNKFGIKIKIPLIKFISKLSKTSFNEIWVTLYQWFLAELVLLHLEGDFNWFFKLKSLLPNLSTRGRTNLFCEFLYYFNEHLQMNGHISSVVHDKVTDKLFEYVNSSGQRQEDFVSMVSMIMAPTPDHHINAIMIMENWAKLSEYWGIETYELPIIDKDKPKYYFLLNLYKNKWKNKIGNTGSRLFVQTLLAIFELSLYPTILPHDILLNTTNDFQNNPLFFNPQSRILNAFDAALKIGPIRNYYTDYTPFIEEICHVNNWITPMNITNNTINHFQYNHNDYYSKLYIQAQKIRQSKPWTFIDYNIWVNVGETSPDDFQWLYDHPIIETIDKTVYHKDKNYVQYSIIVWLTNAYLRKVMFSRDVSLSLPFLINQKDTDLQALIETHLMSFLNICELKDFKIKIHCDKRM